MPRSTLKDVACTIGVLGAAGATGLVWANLETRRFTLRNATVPILPKGARDVRVLHISDLHLTPGQDKKVAWVRALADLEPDFVVNTGDNMAHREVLPTLLHALQPLLRVPGAFAMGSNDYYAPVPKNPARYLLPDARAKHAETPPALPWEELALAMTSAGWHDLTNTRATQKLAGIHFDLVGTDDAHLNRDHFPAPIDATGGTRESDVSDHGGASDVGDPVNTGHVKIGVTHAPYQRVLNAMLADGCDLMIAGHTHGGQLCLPGIGALVTNSDLDRARAKGLHGWPGPRPDEFGGHQSAWLHVSAGLGTSPYAPVRFACPPEATLLTLTAQD